MFSSPLTRVRRANNDTKEIATPYRDTSTIEYPMDEFNYLLDRLDCLMELSRDAYEEPQKEPADEKSSMGFFRRSRKKDKSPAAKTKEENTKEEAKDTLEKDGEAKEDGKLPSTPTRPKRDKDDDEEMKPPSSPPPQLTSTRFNRNAKKGDAQFMPIVEEDECVEIIRRVAELVIIGERVVSTQIDKEDKKKKHQAKQGWGDSIMEDETIEFNARREMEAGSEAYAGIFDLFFERNGLGTIIDILTGKVFQQAAAVPESPVAAAAASSSNNKNSGDGTSADSSDKDTTAEDGDTFEDAKEHEHSDNSDTDGRNKSYQDFTEDRVNVLCKLLPSIKVATQAVQSISILVQNVSRATSLYFVLSNNYINELIDLPLHFYSKAERKHHGNLPLAGGRHFSTPELAELTTHFVTFLKSLAMRMNTETLQFYLRYPSDKESKDNEGESEETKARAIEFPLYARALDFCAAHHDNFVRLTAMNICMNTLRLTTVPLVPVVSDDQEEPDAEMGSSPDGVLHNANPLPFRERLAIATHTCAPSRVGRLASPIFTKLSNSWCLLQEKFLDLDTPPVEVEIGSSSRKHANAVPLNPIKERERKHNAFKDAAATVQDQLLILDDLLKVGLTALNEQIIEMMFATFVYPLLLQPLLVYYQSLPSNSGDTPPMHDPFNGRALDRSTVDFNQIGRAPPHVTAPAKTALFMLASVFHLVTNSPLIRLLYTALFHPLSPAAAGETVISAEGCVITIDENGKKDIRIDELFNKKGQEREAYPFGGQETESSQIDHNLAESCVFVLSPALAEVLSFTGGTDDTLSNTRANPYRKAILQLLEVPHHMSDLRKLSVCTVDAAISKFSGEFLASTLLGINGTEHTKLMNEVVFPLSASLVNGKPGPFGTWKLQFDPIAAHALFCACWKCPEALELASQIIEERYWKAAILLSSIPARIPTTQHLGSIMNLVFYDAASKRRNSTFSDLYYMKNTAPERFSTGIASSSTFRSLCNRSYEAPPNPVLLDTFNEHTAMDLGSSSCRAMLKLDAVSAFLKHVSKDRASLIQGVNPFGFALTSDRGLVDTKMSYNEDLTRSVHSYLSKEFCDTLTDSGDEAAAERPLPGSIVALAGRTAMPCVCEAPAFTDVTDNGAKMVVEGITWQSLYLVFFGSFLVLAEPASGSAGSGRVVASCLLSRLSVARDPNPPADVNSPARRILMAYKWFDASAPGLFVFDEAPKEEGYGPFNKTRLWRSKLDIWFEDEGAAAHAYHSIHFQIDKAKTMRGDRILDFLTSHNEQ